MSGSTAIQRARSQLNFLKQTVERFERFHIANYRREIQDFVDYFAQDDVVGVLSRALYRRMPADVVEWHSRVQQSCQVEPLPADPAAAFAFRLGTLRRIRIEKLDLRFLVSNVFPGAHLNEKLMHWKRLVVHPFAADCRAIADVLLERMGEGEWVDLEGLVEQVLDGPFGDVGFGPRSWDDEDDRRAEEAEAAAASVPERPAPAPPRGDDPAAALADLEQAIQGAAVSPAVRADLLRDVEALRLEARRVRRRDDRIQARLKDIARRSELASHCAAVARGFSLTAS